MTLLSMSELTTYRWSLDEDLFYYSRAGYDGVGIWLRKLQDFGEERGLELIADSGLAVSNVVWAGGFTGSDGASIPESLDATRRALQLAHAMRAGCLVLHTGGRNCHTLRHAQRLMRSSIDELLPAAEVARTPLAIEPMHPCCAADWTVLTTLESALELVQEYDTPWLRLVYDTYHFPLAEPQWDLIPDLAPYTAVVHVGDHATPHSHDQERCPLGEGVAPLGGIVREFEAAGYRGFFDVELMGPAIEAHDYHALIQRSRSFLSSVSNVSLSA